MIQLCPKCNGQGMVSKPPWVAGDVTEWVADRTEYPCDVCHGNKIMFIYDTKEGVKQC